MIIMEKSQFIKETVHKIIIKEFNSLYKKKRTINENTVLGGKTIINVDIQPEYESYINKFRIGDWINFLNQNAQNNQIVFLYNGADTLGMVSEGDYQMWLIEHGLEEEVLDRSVFYDKGYAFFRYCMDNGIDEDNIADFVKFMQKHDINDSRMMDENQWQLFMQEYGHDQSDVRDLLEHSDDMISIPDLMDFIQRYNNIVLTGGGINECLKEVEIALLALEKPFSILQQYTY